MPVECCLCSKEIEAIYTICGLNHCINCYIEKVRDSPSAYPNYRREKTQKKK